MFSTTPLKTVENPVTAVCGYWYKDTILYYLLCQSCIPYLVRSYLGIRSGSTSIFGGSPIMSTMLCTICFLLMSYGDGAFCIHTCIHSSCSSSKCICIVMSPHWFNLICLLSCSIVYSIQQVTIYFHVNHPVTMYFSCVNDTTPLCLCV